MYVSQAILTPRKSTIAKRPFSSLEKALVRKWNVMLVHQWLPQVKDKKLRPNIVIADFNEMHSISETIVDLNYDDDIMELERPKTSEVWQ